jgi:hypothetical protein
MLGNNKKSIGFDSNLFSSNGGNIIDPQALLFYDRVIADGGVVPTGLIGVSATFKAVKAIYGVTDITTAISVFYDAHYLAYKKGTGVGATAGMAIEKLYSACGASGDCVQTTLASQPLLLEHSGTNYVWLSGVAGNYFNTPNALANQITGDIDIIAYIKYRDNANYQYIVSKQSGNGVNFSFEFIWSGIGSNNRLEFYTGNAGGIVSMFDTYTSIAFTGWVRVTRIASTGAYSFYRSLDAPTTAIGSINWTLNSSGTSTISNINNVNATLNVGQNGFGSALPFIGSIYRATISNSIGGAPVVDFNPNSYNAATSQSTWTSSTGEVWTRNRDVLTTGLKAAIVDYTMLMSNGTSHAMQAASLNLNSSAFTAYLSLAKYNNTVTSIITELGVDPSTVSGFYFATNEGAFNTDGVSINGNVGQNGSSYLSNSLLLRLATVIGDTTLASPETLYFNNNSAATLNATYASANNTANMNGTALNLFARNNGSSLFFNGGFRNLLLAKQSDGTTIRTNVYNLIRTNYNNAF